MTENRYSFFDSIPDAVRLQSIELLDAWHFQNDVDSLYVEPLEGGLNNVDLILSDGSNKWVLTIRPPDCEVFGAASESSLQAQKVASLLGIAPKVIPSHNSEWHFISEFIVGETLRPEIVRKNNLYREVIQIIQVFHGRQCNCRDFSIFSDIRL